MESFFVTILIIAATAIISGYIGYQAGAEKERRTDEELRGAIEAAIYNAKADRRTGPHP